MQSDHQLPYSVSADEQQIQTISVNHFDVQTYSLKRILSIARRRIKLIVAVGTVVFGASLAWSLTRPPIYATNFRLVTGSITPKVIPLVVESEQTNYTTLLEVLRSPKVLGLVANALKNVYPDVDYGNLVQNVGINLIKGTNILDVTYTNQDPEKVRAVSEKLAEVFLNYGKEIRESSIGQGISFLDQELPKTQKRANALQAQLEAFRQKYSLIDPLTRAAELSGLLNNNIQQQELNRTKITELQNTYAVLRKQLGFDGDQAIESSSLVSSERYQGLLNRLQEIDTQIASQSQRFQADSPQIQSLNEQRQNLLPLLEREAQNTLGKARSPNSKGNLTGVTAELNTQLAIAANQLKILRSQTQSLQATEKRLKQDFALAPSLVRQFTDLQRELSITNQSLDRFLVIKETLRVQVAQKGDAWNLISLPSRPNFPIGPNTPQNLTLGLLGSLFLAAVAAIIAERFDDVFHSPTDLQSLRLPILGTIPFRQELKDASRSSSNSRALPGNEEEMQLAVASPSKSSKSKSRYYSYNYNSSRFIEAFRSLHTSIRLLSIGSPVRSLVITSALPSDGKSTISYQLAVAAAAMGQRVLLVDADLRRPRVHVRSGLPNQQGLSTAIATDEDIIGMIQRSTLDERLYILTAGQIPPDPTRLLSSPKMRNLMDHLESEFDLVIYDTPPVLGFADSLLLSSYTDGCVLIVGLGQTERSAITEALTCFQTAGTPVLGMVANCLKKYTTDDFTYGQTYGRYYYTDRIKPQVT